MSTPLKVLIVDDSPYDRGMVRRELKQEFDVVEVIDASNSTELAAALETQFDLVITDYQIRWTDGLRVLRSVKERQPDCPVLMFTATGNEEVAVEAMKSGLDDYIIKNVNHLVRLRASARSALENTRTRVRAQQLELQLSALLNHLRVGVFRRRPDGTVVEANDAAAAILGLASGADLAGQKISDAIVKPVVSTQNIPCLGEPTADVEVQAKRRDGNSICLSISERAVTGSDGELLVEGMLDDVTARCTAEEQVRLLLDQMAHADRLNSLAEMATGIAHELNQPLSAIANCSAVCEMKLQNFEDKTILEVADMISQIKEMAYESGQIIRGLRDYTQRRPLSLTELHVVDLVRAALTMVAVDLRTNSVSVQWEAIDDLPPVLADPVQIRQVLVNLMTNAIAAMADQESQTRELSIQIGRTPEAVRISVSDNGTGIAEDQWDQLFEPFVSNKPDGVGIGLPICRRIVEIHGGLLTARNNAGGGATFEFTIPWSPAQADC